MPSVTSRKEARPSLKLTLGSGPVPLAGSAHGTNEVRTLGVGPVLTENENVFYKLKPELLFKKKFFFLLLHRANFSPLAMAPVVTSVNAHHQFQGWHKVGWLRAGLHCSFQEKPLAPDHQGLGIRVCLLSRETKTQISAIVYLSLLPFRVSDCHLDARPHIHSADWLCGPKSVFSSQMRIMILTSQVGGGNLMK